jgi:hypothetical protein
MDAEQNYGILGQYPGAAGARPTLGGDHARWRALERVQSGGGMARSLRAGSDEGYLYLALEMPAGPIDWDSLGVLVAIDTYRPDAGQLTLPGAMLRSEVGFEFLLELRSPDDARLRILPAYNPYAGESSIQQGDDFGRFYRRPATIGVETDGRFDPMYVITNRARFGRDGTFFPAQGYDRGRLNFGTSVESSLADWYADPAGGLLEIRLPWGLLNVTDPSSRRPSTGVTSSTENSARRGDRPGWGGGVRQNLSAPIATPRRGERQVEVRGFQRLDLGRLGGSDIAQPAQAGVRFIAGDVEATMKVIHPTPFQSEQT